LIRRWTFFPSFLFLKRLFEAIAFPPVRDTISLPERPYNIASALGYDREKGSSLGVLIGFESEEDWFDY